jgi:DNA-binding CsgD family transcriptional regulator
MTDPDAIRITPPTRFSRFVEDAVYLTDVSDLLRHLRAFLDGFGIDVLSYQIVADDLYKVPIDHGLIYEDFPDAWIRHYIDDDLERIDPILEYSRRAPSPFHWSDVEKRMRLTPAQLTFLKELRASGLTDGLAIPIYSAIGDMAYFGIGVKSGTLDLRAEALAQVVLACQLTHNRYVSLVNARPRASVPLSPRETESLSLVACGLSKNEVGKKRGISANTVDTLLRRSFDKLGTKSRLEAVLLAIGSGLILPDRAQKPS